MFTVQLGLHILLNLSEPALFDAIVTLDHTAELLSQQRGSEANSGIYLYVLEEQPHALSSLPPLRLLGCCRSCLPQFFAGQRRNTRWNTRPSIPRRRPPTLYRPRRLMTSTRRLGNPLTRRSRTRSSQMMLRPQSPPLKAPRHDMANTLMEGSRHGRWSLEGVQRR
ncbi:hypothetical protein OH76DRAFT_807038 [Lentinus brumalis]|uniref:Uncharacterized protein n=1 Tax=Lentinus brumalis TaxID=2498619 RepID=A0A371D2Y0_9APHY|nr:hypothetical protein OH76DRAFT_807038 [Polyporus brumalis]